MCRRGTRIAAAVPRRVAQGLVEERGVALVIAMAAMTLLLALGSAIVLSTIGDARIVANVRASDEVLYAAEAAVALAIPDVVDDIPSRFIDGPPSGVRSLSDGSRVDLGVETSLVRSMVTIGRDWRLVAHGPLSLALPDASAGRGIYVLVWMGHGQPGSESRFIALLGQAYAPRGARRGIEVTLAREDGLPRILSWRALP